MVYRPEAMRYLSSLGPVVFLDVPLPTILERLARKHERHLKFLRHSPHEHRWIPFADEAERSEARRSRAKRVSFAFNHHQTLKE